MENSKDLPAHESYGAFFYFRETWTGYIGKVVVSSSSALVTHRRIALSGLRRWKNCETEPVEEEPPS